MQDKRNISSSDLEQQVYKQNYTLGIINESGLYAAIFGSKQENAKSFKRWVTSEVLPSIRKTGGYGVPQTIPEQIYRNFEVSTYKALKRNQCDMVIEIVGKYELPIVLKDQIEQANAQQRLNLKGGE